MTTLLDRLTNQHVKFQDLTGPVVPGRFLLLSDAKINNQPEIQPSGSFLCGDATGLIRINNHVITCLDQLDDKDDIQFQLASQAIHQIADNRIKQGRKLPSPLLPSQLVTQAGELNELETLLQVVLNKGHLHEISRRPRINMRYDELVQDVSRAKRLASSAHRHLASHSECWQSRSFTGIQPKRIMSLVSEDEYNLYENRVFSRLLDRLERFLGKRLCEITQLQQTIYDAMDLEQSTELNYRLSQALYALWGETFTAEDTLQAADKLEETQQALEHQLRTIKGLMHTGVYARVPKNAQVATRLELTNILTHDPHYRYLFPLWNTLAKVSRDFELTEQERFEEQCLLQKDYVDYCGLLIERALDALGFNKSVQQNNVLFIKGEHHLCLSQKNSNWIIYDENFAKTISLCPVATWHSKSINAFSAADGIVIPCALSTDQQPAHPAHWLNGHFNSALQLSPLDFYVEERLISLFNSWFILDNVVIYGAEIAKLPTDVLDYADEITGMRVNHSRHSIQILQPIQQNEINQLLDICQKTNAQKARQQCKAALFSLAELSTCPVCQSKAVFIPRDGRTFKAECSKNSCKLIYTLEHQFGERCLLLSTKDTGSTSFMQSGRWYQQTRIFQG